MKSYSCPEQRFEESNGESIGRRVCHASKLVVVALLAAVCGSFSINGCAAFEIRTQRTALSDSGFLARMPETPKQRETYAALPPYKLYRGVKNGNVFYAYKDEKSGVVYVGSEADYQRYMEKWQRLVAAYEMPQEKMVAHDMDNDLQWRWYGSWSNFGDSDPRD